MLEKAKFKRFNTFRRFIVLGQQSRKQFVGLLVSLLKLVPAENWFHVWSSVSQLSSEKSLVEREQQSNPTHW